MAQGKAIQGPIFQYNMAMNSNEGPFGGRSLLEFMAGLDREAQHPAAAEPVLRELPSGGEVSRSDSWTSEGSFGLLL